ncbi:MAG: hypothetical protein HGB05_00910 [Chloroflexi bacterium]|nr:hypothetical protein [Chloroflexota bacterium]
MNLLNKWIRMIHRWLAVPLVLAVAAALIGSAAGGGSELPSWIGLAALLTLLSLLVTGVYLFAQHYLRKIRRARTEPSV